MSHGADRAHESEKRAAAIEERRYCCYGDESEHDCFDDKIIARFPVEVVAAYCCEGRSRCSRATCFKFAKTKRAIIAIGNRKSAVRVTLAVLDG